MIMTKFVFNPVAFQAFVNKPTGVVGRTLQGVGQDVATKAIQALGDPWPGGPHPPPPDGRAIPYARTGDLAASIKETDPFPYQGSIAVGVKATAKHGGFDYPARLLERGYRFIDPADIPGLKP